MFILDDICESKPMLKNMFNSIIIMESELNPSSQLEFKVSF